MTSSNAPLFTSPPVETLRGLVRARTSGNLQIEAALHAADEIVVFGSFACGSAGERSDLDILLVGSDQVRLKNRQIDLISLGSDEVESGRWTRSELAHHVASFGVWLRGSAKWIHRVRPGLGAIRRKENRIVASLGRAFLSRAVWPKSFARRTLNSVCLDVMRLGCLARAEPVPSRQMLMVDAIDTEFEAFWRQLQVMGQPFEEMFGGVAKSISAEEHEGQESLSEILVPRWKAELNQAAIWRSRSGLP